MIRELPFAHLPKAVALVMALAVLGGCVGAPPRTNPPPAPPDVAKVPDALPRAEPRSSRGNPPFYEVFGQRYFVLPTAEGYVERGVASWYGPGFHAASTSNGERYDMYAMTAAHKTLPLPCYVQVTNLKNGRSVVVRVNDRGPFKDGRIIDLSYTAAAKLDMLKEGTTFVEVRALTPGQATVADTPAPPAGLYVQAGAFASEANASRLLTQLRSQGLDKSFVRAEEKSGKRLYRVRIGPIADVGAFDQLIAQLKSMGVVDARLAD